MSLTSGDFIKIEKLIKSVVEPELAGLKLQIDRLPTRDDYDQIRDQISHLPTKDEYFSSQDVLVSELKDLREELTLISYRVSQHSDEIAALQKHRN